MLAAGQLSWHAANQIHASYGDGRPCDVCGEETSRSDVMYELHFRGAGEGPSVVMHYACYDLWENERVHSRLDGPGDEHPLGRSDS